MPGPVRIVLLASGTGTTVQAVLDAAGDADFSGEIVAAGTDVKGCRAMARAEAAGIPTFAVGLHEFADRDAWNDAFAAAVAEHRPDLVVLAGFMRLLGPAVVGRFRIVNTHPALLPAFPGAHAVRDALAAGVAESGVTVHWVDEGVDTGEVIDQARVPVLPGDDEARLHSRIQAVEKPLYVRVIKQICQELSE